MLNITLENLITELESTEKIVGDWAIRCKTQMPIPNGNATEEEFNMFIKQLVGEARLAAGKLDNLADILSGLR